MKYTRSALISLTPPPPPLSIIFIYGDSFVFRMHRRLLPPNNMYEAKGEEKTTVSPQNWFHLSTWRNMFNALSIDLLIYNNENSQ